MKNLQKLIEEKKDLGLATEFALYLSILFLAISADLFTKIQAINTNDSPDMEFHGFVLFDYVLNDSAKLIPTYTFMFFFFALPCVVFYFKFLRACIPYLGLYLGGGMSNQLDLYINGSVVDFISMNICNNIFVYNCADIFVFIGLAGVILSNIISLKNSESDK